MIVSQYGLFNTRGLSARVCFIQTTHGAGQHGRKDPDNAAAVDSFGARHIRSEVQANVDIVPISRIGDYDFALLSLTSVVEIENVLWDISRLGLTKGKCKIIVGGMGCLNIWPLRDIVDIAVFGRAEGQINDIIDGKRPPNVWDKEYDPWLEDSYEIRQASTLLPGERGIGCPNKCAYCQYTHVRTYYNQGTGYRAAAVDSVYEDDWNRIQFKQGRNITAWDGLSQDTRYKVHKAVSDDSIRRKLIELRERNLPRTANIKLFNIVGYPWETPESYKRDMDNVASLLESCDGPGGRVLIMMMHTPFSPEPYTPMQGETIGFTDWREVANSTGFNGVSRQIYKGRNIEAFVLPQIIKPDTLRKRIILNYLSRNTYQRAFEAIKNPPQDVYSFLGSSPRIVSLAMPAERRIDEVTGYHGAAKKPQRNSAQPRAVVEQTGGYA